MSSTLAAPPDGDRNRAAELNAIAWSWTVVAAICVALRVYSRLLLTRNMWWDDHFIVLTMVIVFAQTIFWTVLGADNGCRHLYYLTPEQAMSASRINWIAQPFAIMGLAFGKISVAFLLLRLIGPKSCWRRNFLYFSMIASFLFCALACIFTFAQCRPVQALWNPSLVASGQAKCWKPESQSSFSLFVGSWLTFMDVALALLPMTIVYPLQLSLNKKIGLSILMGLGIFAAICAAIKTSKLTTLNARADLTWQTVTLWIWNANESGVVIIAACVPTLRPLYLIIFRRPGAEAYDGGGKKQSYPYSHDGSGDGRGGGTAPGGSANGNGNGGGGGGRSARRMSRAAKGYVRSPSLEEEQGGLKGMQAVVEEGGRGKHGVSATADGDGATWLEMQDTTTRSPTRPGGGGGGGSGGSGVGNIRRTIDVDVDIERQQQPPQYIHEGGAGGGGYGRGPRKISVGHAA